MHSVVADIASGEVDIADILFLVAVILFVIGGVIAIQVKTLYAALVAFGLACMALAWLLL